MAINRIAKVQTAETLKPDLVVLGSGWFEQVGNRPRQARAEEFGRSVVVSVGDWPDATPCPTDFCVAPDASVGAEMIKIVESVFSRARPH